MFLGWKEIQFNKSKYILISTVLVLLIFMVLFLSGLANGLARATSAIIEDSDASSYILSNDADSIIPRSSIPLEVLKDIEPQLGSSVTPINLQRMNFTISGNTTKMDITYMAVDMDSFMMPKVFTGKGLSNESDTIVLDDSFIDESIAIGDVIKDSTSGMEFKVAGFSNDILYGHSPIGVISLESFTTMQTSIDPGYSQSYHALAIKGDSSHIQYADELEIIPKQEIISNIPGYSAEQTTIQMILWVLVVVSAAILGVFFYILTIQKLPEFGVLKALGSEMSMLARIIFFQVLFIAGFSMLLGNLLTFLMAMFLPNSMPFSLNPVSAVFISLIYLIISILASMLSLRRVSKVDPLMTIGGNA